MSCKKKHFFKGLTSLWPARVFEIDGNVELRKKGWVVGRQLQKFRDETTIVLMLKTALHVDCECFHMFL